MLTDTLRKHFSALWDRQALGDSNRNRRSSRLSGKRHCRLRPDGGVLGAIMVASVARERTLVSLGTALRHSYTRLAGSG